MHMADALISPAVGATMWAASGAVTAYSARRINRQMDDRKIPLMGILGAFVFSAQMINFAIPLTGSSGHLGGGMLLAILLGPHAAFLTIASVLTIQALFFADGGLLALGCNVFNLGFFPCFVAYPLIYRPLAGRRPTPGRLLLGATVASVAGLQLGALAVVIETVSSGISELPFKTFALLMLPIHLAIGIVEGIVTAAVVGYVWKIRPEIVEAAGASRRVGPLPMARLLASLAVAAALTAGVLSWFASSSPDGLEWAMIRASGREELSGPGQGIHARLERLQQRTAFLPDYDFPKPAAEEFAADSEGAAPVVQVGTSVAGLVGAALTLALALAIGLALRAMRPRALAG